MTAAEEDLSYAERVDRLMRGESKRFPGVFHESALVAGARRWHPAQGSP